jgi:acetyltransferase
LRTTHLDQRVAHDRLVRICFNDYDRNLALISVTDGAGSGQPEVSAVARLVKKSGGQEAELSLLVEDGYQSQGLGKELARRLLQVAAAEGLERVVAHILDTNQAMQGLCRGLGFQLSPDGTGNSVLAIYELSAPH